MSLLDAGRQLFQEDVRAFWSRRETWQIKLWIYLNIAVFLALQLLGATIPGFDFLTGVIFDEIVQILITKPALKELWRREEATKLEEREASDKD